MPPTEHPDDRLRYESWGRLVGVTQSTVLTVSGPPTTSLSRCEYVWQFAKIMQSTNGLGTLEEYVLARL